MSNLLFSMIVEGDIAVVDAIMKKHGVKYRAADFYPGKGYDFIINDDRAADLTALNELGNCPDVESCSCAYITSANDIEEFYK